MAKYNNDDEIAVEKPVKIVAKKEKETVLLKFAQNRSYELSIDNQRFFMRFNPYEVKEVPKWIITHKDFENISRLFVIKED